MAKRVKLHAGRRLVARHREAAARYSQPRHLTPPSGSGKTTILNLLGGLTRPSRGKVWIAGREISELPDKELAKVRLSRIGFCRPILQPAARADRRRERGVHDAAGGARAGTPRAGAALVCGDRAGGAGGPDAAAKLSGGQQQRVAVARAVLAEPALVLADEPTANLDSTMAEALLDVMEKLNREEGTTFVFSTHHPR